MNFAARQAYTESSSADTRLDDAAVEAVLPISSMPFTENERPSVQWAPLMYASSSYIGVMHGFRFATEPSTRNAMGNQPFGYFAALGAMHGWSDGPTLDSGGKRWDATKLGQQLATDIFGTRAPGLRF